MFVLISSLIYFVHNFCVENEINELELELELELNGPVTPTRPISERLQTEQKRLHLILSGTNKSEM